MQWRRANLDSKMSELSESGAQNLAQMPEKHRIDQTNVVWQTFYSALLRFFSLLRVFDVNIQNSLS